MSEFIQIKLDDMISELGESETKSILSLFTCPKNRDVEDFIKYKAIEFSKQGLAKTTLVYWQSDDKLEKNFVGYFALASKYLCVRKDSVSNKLSGRLYRHGTYNDKTREYIVPAPLIGQLSKNYTDGNNFIISGSDLLQMALVKVRKIQEDLGGKFVYLECENNSKLIQFYKANGFTVFGKRKKDRDEIDIDGEYLVQLLKYLT